MTHAADQGSNQNQHNHAHAFAHLHARRREGLVLVDRRGMLKAGLAGMAGLSLPGLLQTRAAAARAAGSSPAPKSVILLWMAGGPSHIDTWDPKPERPPENRGPFSVTSTRLPGVRICEHLPRQAAMLDKFTLIRSVDARHSNHEPNKVFQTGHLDAAPRVSPKGELYPAIGSIVGRYRGSNHPAMPAYAAFMKSRSHLAFAGYLGKRYDPFIADQATDLPIYTNVGVDTGQTTGARLFDMAEGLTPLRLRSRTSLLAQLDQLRSDLDLDGSMQALDYYSQQAVEMVVGQRARDALDIRREPEQTRQRYGNHLWCQQALLARRMVEAGVAFVTLDLSYHTASGTWDTHGDNIPPYGGIKNGLGPLLPLFDHLITTLVSDLEERGLLDQTLVIAMGEFGRTPQIGTQGSTDGRNHWPVVMSMCLAGGGLRHGQVIGATERDGGQIASRPVTPGDLAATIYRYLDVPLETAYLDDRGRPIPIVQNDGQPIAELF
ncbi:MAG: DUF1501 domain-containing protein [Pirellulaceae bacterium]|nr:DUF1501 domain-containing protein [Pirellulaceae bacterium]